MTVSAPLNAYMSYCLTNSLVIKNNSYVRCARAHPQHEWYQCQLLARYLHLDIQYEWYQCRWLLRVQILCGTLRARTAVELVVEHTRAPWHSATLGG